jgi:hypothetical protein
LRTLIGARLDGVGAREHLLGPGAFGAQRVDLVGGPRVVETGLLVVEQRLVLVARPLRVVEDLLGGSASRLRQPGLHLAAIEVGAFGTVARTGVDLLMSWDCSWSRLSCSRSTIACWRSPSACSRPAMP